MTPAAGGRRPRGDREADRRDWLLLSEAQHRLEQGMFGGLPRTDRVRTLKKTSPSLSVGSGEWKEASGQRLRTAVVTGDLAVCVLSRSGDSPRLVPPEVLSRLIAPHGAIPDTPYRLSRSLLDLDVMSSELFSALDGGDLVVDTSKFDAWYRREYRRGRWASQRRQPNRKRQPRGRPDKDTADFRQAILLLAQSDSWFASQGVAALRRILIADGYAATADTVARIVDRMFEETGDVRFARRTNRKRSQNRKTARSQNKNH